MDINYYDEHQEEFEAVKLALRGEMERIWGSMLKERPAGSPAEVAERPNQTT